MIIFSLAISGLERVSSDYTSKKLQLCSSLYRLDFGTVPTKVLQECNFADLKRILNQRYYT
jgi:hypothetical protein